MKKILLFLLPCILLASCSEWDDYYKEETPSANGENTTELSITMSQFFAEKSEYSAFYKLLKDVKLSEQLDRDQRLTLWVAKNDQVNESGLTDLDTLTMAYHMNNLSFTESELKDGLRIRTISGIYIQITRDEENKPYANESQVLESFQLTNGTVHIIDKMLIPRLNMYDYLMELDDDYSIIRDSIFQFNTLEFDRANSRPLSVDPTGNTVYDSVFIIKNKFVDSIQFNSEFKQFTVFIPKNNVVTECLENLKAMYAGIGQEYTPVEEANAMAWIREALFFNGTTAGQSTEVDITSAFKKQWRTTVQQIDRENPYYLSNGEAYECTKLKIPNNFVITRIKSLLHYWEYLSDAEKTTLYTIKGMSAAAVSIAELDNSGFEQMPKYRSFTIDGSGTPDSEEFSVEFAPLEMYVEAGIVKAREMKIPVGEYEFYMGFRSSVHPFVDFYFDGNLLGEKVDISKSTPWNYDRVTETSPSKWNGLGGLVGTVTVASEEGEALSTFRAKVKYNALYSGGTKKMTLYHWALKPTANNY